MSMYQYCKGHWFKSGSKADFFFQVFFQVVLWLHHVYSYNNNKNNDNDNNNSNNNDHDHDDENENENDDNTNNITRN